MEGIRRRKKQRGKERGKKEKRKDKRKKEIGQVERKDGRKEVRKSGESFFLAAVRKKIWVLWIPPPANESPPCDWLSHFSHSPPSPHSLAPSAPPVLRLTWPQLQERQTSSSSSSSSQSPPSLSPSLSLTDSLNTCTLSLSLSFAFSLSPSSYTHAQTGLAHLERAGGGGWHVQQQH